MQGPKDYELNAHAEEALRLGRVVEIVALQSVDGFVPGAEVLADAKEAALRQPGVLAVHAALAAAPGEEQAGVLLVVRQGSSAPKDVGTAAARATGLAAGVATSEGHRDVSLDDLMTVASEGLGVARSDGGAKAVHSELYDLIQVLRGRSAMPIDYQAPSSVARPLTEDYELPAAVLRPPRVQAPSGRTESDDPFAYIDTRNDALTDARAAALTRGIAPGESELAKLARAHFQERDALRSELDGLRSDAGGSGSDGEPATDPQERRIQKLLRQLQAAEGEINKLRSSKDKDPGLASFFKSVQGLDPAAPHAAAKRGMLDTVFRQNHGQEGAPKTTGAADD